MPKGSFLLRDLAIGKGDIEGSGGAQNTMGEAQSETGTRSGPDLLSKCRWGKYFLF